MRRRRGETAALVAVAALITACIGFAPVYDRAMQQALVHTLLTQASTSDRVVAIESESAVSAIGTTQARDPRELRDLVPEGVSSRLGEPVLGRTAIVAPTEGRVPPSGQLVWRDGACEHVRILAGACPAAAGEILVSEADLETFDLSPGTTLDVAPAEDAPSVPLVVVGTYEPAATSWWQGLQLVGQSSITEPDNPEPSALHDAWLTAEETFERAGVLPAEVSSAGALVPLDSTGVEELAALEQQLRQLGRDVRGEGRDLKVRSTVDEVAESVAVQTSQARRTVPLLMAPMVVLALFVLWLVLAAATEQRRGTVAVARLRGRRPVGAARLLLADLLPVLLAGAVPGAALALLGGVVARWLLPGSGAFEVVGGFVAATGLAIAALVLTAVVSVVRVARQPLDQLVRSDRVQGGRWTLGVLDAVLLATVGSGALAFLAGGLSGSFALAGPALLALFVGLVLAHLSAPAADRLGRRLLDRGRLVSGLTLLDLGRRRETRTVIAVMTVASALAVFSVDALVVGERNRVNASEHDAGAPVVLQLTGTDLGGVRAALDAADPTGRRATPVVVARELLAVEPDGFRSVAFFPRGAPTPEQWDALAPPDREPVTLSGTRFSLTARTDRGFSATDFFNADSEARVNLVVTTSIGVRETIQIGPLPSAGSSATLAARSDVCVAGCQLAAVEFSAAQGVVMAGDLELSGLAVDGQPVDWGSSPDDWNTTEGKEAVIRPVASSADDVLGLQVDIRGFYPVELTPAWVPSVVPALLTRPPSDPLDVEAKGLNGDGRAIEPVGTITLVPTAAERASLVDLDAITRGATISLYSRAEVWLDDDPALQESVRSELRRRGIAVTGERRHTAVRERYDDTIPSWSLTLGAVVGPAVVLIALLVLLALAVIGWRERARDLAVLRLNGASAATTRRIAAWAQLPAVLVAIVGGVAAGLVGALIAMPEVSFYPTPPDIPITDTATAWSAVLLAAAACLVVLPAVAVLTGRAVARRSHLERVKESQ